ncbi:hypothetical protein [Schleiferilactobacillus harbinensis]|uniref:Phage protein n=1 Tax=Schleiferilactobacillus harbinensis TaxID=304207 RepID=A0A5P8M3Z9_9LACO|nr:hypothetical protein [Schleiferilactobacillus harbinensis]QFR23210.1 hypothetical protein D1010_07235 [Schleiferilactobacillus harbinensis]
MKAKKYRKTATIEAEQFDGSKEMAHKYGIHLLPKSLKAGNIKTLEGTLTIYVGDWIATGINGEHWPIADDIFRKTYVEAEK